MVTGIDCAGLILGALPLVIEAAKVYRDGVDTIRDVVQPSRRDAALQEFYETFLWEVQEFEYQAKDIIDSLPRLSDERKLEITENLHSADWGEDSDVAQALRDYFSTGNDFNRFEWVMRKIVELMGQLVSDNKAVNISRSEMVKTPFLRLFLDF